jgi:hypothetical protein
MISKGQLKEPVECSSSMGNASCGGVAAARYDGKLAPESREQGKTEVGDLQEESLWLQRRWDHPALVGRRVGFW